MVAAGHAVDVDRGLIARHVDGRIELQRVAAFIILPGTPVKLVELPKHHRAPVLLAHLHRVALQRRPVTMPRILVHCVTDLEPVRRFPAMLLAESREHAPLVSDSIPLPQHAG
jgi:hypothetical protein